MRENLPTITIKTGTFNSDIPTFIRVLESIKRQDYPKELIEHLVFDKGSTNRCQEIAKRYGCQVFTRHESPSQEQVSAAIGVQMAKGEIILVLESDNILTAKDWLRKMVQPFRENKDVFCTFSAYNDYEKTMSATTRCCALFGSPDPTLYYLKKTEKIRLDQKDYNKGEILREKDNYYLVKFNQENLPTLGDNGHMFLKKAMMKVIKDPITYTHTDAFMELLENGYDTFGVVKNSIIHIMKPNVIDLVKRRVHVKKIFYDGRRGKRKYLVFNPSLKQDRRNLFKYIVYSLTFVQPLFVSVKGYLKIRDRAWFLHPAMCFLMVIGYGWSEIQWQFKQAVKKLRV